MILSVYLSPANELFVGVMEMDCPFAGGMISGVPRHFLATELELGGMIFSCSMMLLEEAGMLADGFTLMAIGCYLARVHRLAFGL